MSAEKFAYENIEIPSEYLVFVNCQISFEQLFRGFDLVYVKVGFEAVDVPFAFYIEEGVIVNLFFN